jgi:hypothetical protein
LHQAIDNLTLDEVYFGLPHPFAETTLSLTISEHFAWLSLTGFTLKDDFILSKLL